MGVRLLQSLHHWSGRGVALPTSTVLRRPAATASYTVSQPGFMYIDRHGKSDSQAVECFYLNNNGSNTPSSCVKAFKLSTSSVCYTSNVTWAVARVPVLSPTLPAAGGDSSQDSGEVSRATRSPSYSIHYAAPTTVAATSAVTVSPSAVPATTPSPSSIAPTPVADTQPTTVSPSAVPATTHS